MQKNLDIYCISWDMLKSWHKLLYAESSNWIIQPTRELQHTTTVHRSTELLSVEDSMFKVQ